MAVAVTRRERWTVEMAALVVVGLLAMASPTMQLSVKKPLRGTVQKSSEELRPLGLIVTEICCEKALNESGIFHVNSSVELLGRTFVLGRIRGVDIVYVRSASRPAANVGITLQIMADNFNLGGVILLGYGQALDDSLSVGSVVIPEWIAATGVWKWQPFYAEEEDEGQLKFREFNYPEGGANLLGSVEYEKSQIYVNGKVKETFWIPAISRAWLRAVYMTGVESVEIVRGLKLASADMQLNNEAYKEFLYKTFGASIADTSSFAWLLGAYTNNLQFLVVRGVSGGEDERDMVAANAVKVLERLVFVITYLRTSF